MPAPDGYHAGATPGFLMQQWLLMQVEQQQFIGLDALDPTHEALLVDDEFVDVHRRQVVDQLDAMPGAPMAWWVSTLLTRSQKEPLTL